MVSLTGQLIYRYVRSTIACCRQTLAAIFVEVLNDAQHNIHHHRAPSLLMGCHLTE
jgi:hypothetical protein